VVAPTGIGQYFTKNFTPEAATMTTRKRQNTATSPNSRNDLHNTAVEDADEIPSPWSSADTSAADREGKQHSHPLARISDLIDHADRRYLELSEALIYCPRSRRGPIARLQGTYMRIVTELDECQRDVPRIAGDKRCYAEDFPHRREHEGSRDDIMNRLTGELIGIMTGDKQSTDVFRAIATSLANKLANPRAQAGGIPDTLLQLARATAIVQQLQTSSIHSGTHPANPVFKARQKIIDDTEIIIAREVQSSPLGQQITNSLASSTSHTPFTTYMVGEGAPQAQWAMCEKASAANRDWQPKEPASLAKLQENNTSDMQIAQSPPQPRVIIKPADQRVDPGPPPGQPPATVTHHPVQERCRNHAERECRSSSCHRWHSKYNPKGTPCLAHATPGIWCERSYEIDSPGCPYSHDPPVVQPRSLEPRRLSRTSAGRAPAPKAQLACWYYSQPLGCKKGDYCSHWHPSNHLN